MIIGLMGFECESPNKGCEALGYSFVELIRKIYHEKILFNVFTNDGLGQFPEYFPEFDFVRIPLKIKDATLTTIKAMRQCDCIFDVTLGDSFSDIYSKEQCMSNIKFKIMAEIFGSCYILLPQTYGPFSDKKCLFLSRKIIQHSDHVYCRDEKSMTYLREIGINNQNVELTTDMAFMLPYRRISPESESDIINVGINVSGLLIKGGFRSKNQFGMSFDYSSFIDNLIENFHKMNNVQIHLIPHVIDTNEDAHDDDYRNMEALEKKYPFVILAPQFSNPIEAKSYISGMDFFIGSRMHSTIAAFSSGVPTVPVSYSRKFEGLFESLEYPYIVHGTSDTLEYAIKNIMKWFKDKEILETKLEQSLSKIKPVLIGFEESIQTILFREK